MLSKPNSLVYVSRNSLIAVGKKVKAAKLPIGSNLFDHLEVQDPNKLIGVCQDFFESRGFRGKNVLVVLDPGVVFFKKAEMSESDEAAAITENFTSYMPFEPEQRVVVSLTQEEVLKLYGTNLDLLWCITEALRGCKIGKLIAITPAAAYQLSSVNKPDVAVEQFFSDKLVRRKANFATSVKS